MKEVKVLQCTALSVLSFMSASGVAELRAETQAAQTKLESAKLPELPVKKHRLTFKPVEQSMRENLEEAKRMLDKDQSLRVYEVRAELTERIAKKSVSLSLSRPTGSRHFLMKNPELELEAISDFVQELNAVFKSNNAVKSVTITLR